jgi:hypothetical protein
MRVPEGLLRTPVSQHSGFAGGVGCCDWADFTRPQVGLALAGHGGDAVMVVSHAHLTEAA